MMEVGGMTEEEMIMMALEMSIEEERKRQGGDGQGGPVLDQKYTEGPFLQVSQ